MNTLSLEIIRKIDSYLPADDSWRFGYVCKSVKKALSTTKRYPLKCWMCHKIGPHIQHGYFFDTQQEYLDYPNYLLHYVCDGYHSKFKIDGDDIYPGVWVNVCIGGINFKKYKHILEDKTSRI